MGMLPKGAAPALIIYNYIFNLLQAQTNVGNVMVNGRMVATPGKGSNDTAQLNSVLTVGKSTWPAFGALPFVGLDPPRITLLERYAAPRRDKLALNTKLIAIVDVSPLDDLVLNLDAAWAALFPIMDDGEGNGIQPILRNDSILGGNAIETYFSDIIPGWDKSPAGGAAYVAWWTFQFTAVVTVQADP
jgi:hypothetical protein